MIRAGLLLGCVLAVCAPALANDAGEAAKWRGFELAERLDQGDCADGVQEWRAAARSDDHLDFIKSYFTVLAIGQHGPGWQCFSEHADRVRAVEILADVLTHFDPLARGRAEPGLMRLLGPTWPELLAEAGNVPAMLIAADLHLVCGPKAGQNPLFPDGTVPVDLTECCEFRGTVRDESYAQGFFWYFRALKVDEWIPGTRPLAGALVSYAITPRVDYDLASDAIAPQQLEPLSPEWHTALERELLFQFVNSKEHDPRMIADARAKAQEHRNVELVVP